MSTSDSHMMKAAELPAADRIRLKATFDLPPTSVHAAPAAPTHCRCHPPRCRSAPLPLPYRCHRCAASQHLPYGVLGRWAVAIMIAKMTAWKPAQVEWEPTSPAYIPAETRQRGCWGRTWAPNFSHRPAAAQGWFSCGHTTQRPQSARTPVRRSTLWTRVAHPPSAGVPLAVR